MFRPPSPQFDFPNPHGRPERSLRRLGLSTCRNQASAPFKNVAFLVKFSPFFRSPPPQAVIVAPIHLQVYRQVTGCCAGFEAEEPGEAEELQVQSVAMLLGLCIRILDTF